MAASTASSTITNEARPGVGPTRVLCLGNELIADDGLGIVVAAALVTHMEQTGSAIPTELAGDPAVTVRAFRVPQVGVVELVETALTGMYLLESVVKASRLIVVDSVVTGSAEPGTVLRLREQDLVGPRGGSPHYIGILETLDLARALGLEVPDDVLIVAVEAGDYWTVGGAMTELVKAAVPDVVEMVVALLEGEAAVVHSARDG